MSQTLTDENLNHIILSALSDGVLACNNNGDVIFVNAAAESLVGKPAAQLIGLPIHQVFQIFEAQGRQEILAHLLSLQQLIQVNQAGATDLREAFVEIDKYVISARLTTTFSQHNKVSGIVIVLRDITSEIEASRAKSEFVSTVSHELRTPMTSIKGYTELLRQGAVGPLNKNQKEFLNVVQRNINRLAALINDLLDVSKIESGKVRLNLQDIQLADIAKQVVEIFQVSAEDKNLILNLKVPSNLPTVRADWDRITQVLTNLIGNAIAYTETGSISISLQAVADAVQVSVQDTGIGISPEDMNRVFERFYRADNAKIQAVSGTGLGLPIVKSIVDMHNGRIWVDSKLEKGSTFTFILPTAAGASFSQRRVH